MTREPEHRDLLFMIPRQGCSKDWCKERVSLQCGCPDCLAKIELTLVYEAESWRKDGHGHFHWPRRIVSLRTAKFAKHLILPGFPGSDEEQVREEFWDSVVTPESGDTLPEESLPIEG